MVSTDYDLLKGSLVVKGCGLVAIISYIQQCAETLGPLILLRVIESDNGLIGL